MLPKVLALACLVGPRVSAAEILKVGRLIQASSLGPDGTAASDYFQQLVQDAGLGYTVEFVDGDATSSDVIAASAASLTAPGADQVHALLCPYTSGWSTNCVSGVDQSFTGPVLVWGGATDSIFDTTCVNRGLNCYGTLTPASQYLDPALALIGDQSGNITVQLVESDQTFSQGLCDAAQAFVESATSLSMAGRTQLAATSGNGFGTGQTLQQAGVDTSALDTALATSPDAVVLCGHNTFVEPVLYYIGESGVRPKYVVGTNSITAAALDNLESIAAGATSYAQCVMMPTQWARSTTATDSVLGVTTAGFEANLTSQASYQAASAMGSLLVLAKAMATRADAGNVAPLSEIWQSFPDSFETFYGTLSVDANGKQQKPMVTMQSEDSASSVVAPASIATASLAGYTDTAACWGAASTTVNVVGSGAERLAGGLALALSAAALSQ